MQIVKFLMLFIVFIISNKIGKMIAGRYRYRFEELKEMKNALNVFKNKIKFTYEPIPEIFEEISQNSTKNISNIFIKAKEYMKNKSAEDSWSKAIEEVNSNFNEDDKKTLNVLSKMLGKSDIEGQVSQIDITLTFLEKQIEQAEQEKNKNEKLYQKLGTIMGLAIVIILI